MLAGGDAARETDGYTRWQGFGAAGNAGVEQGRDVHGHLPGNDSHPLAGLLQGRVPGPLRAGRTWRQWRLELGAQLRGERVGPTDGEGEGKDIVAIRLIQGLEARGRVDGTRARPGAGRQHLADGIPVGRAQRLLQRVAEPGECAQAALGRLAQRPQHLGDRPLGDQQKEFDLPLKKLDRRADEPAPLLGGRGAHRRRRARAPPGRALLALDQRAVPLLLNDMSEFVGEQGAPVGRLGGIAPRAKAMCEPTV